MKIAAFQFSSVPKVFTHKCQKSALAQEEQSVQNWPVWTRPVYVRLAKWTIPNRALSHPSSVIFCFSSLLVFTHWTWQLQLWDSADLTQLNAPSCISCPNSEQHNLLKSPMHWYHTIKLCYNTSSKTLKSVRRKYIIANINAIFSLHWLEQFLFQHLIIMFCLNILLRYLCTYIFLVYLYYQNYILFCYVYVFFHLLLYISYFIVLLNI